MYHKIITIILSMLIVSALLSGCAKESTTSDESVTEVKTTEITISTAQTESSAPVIEIGVSGEILNFPFKYEDLEKLIDLSDCQNVYFEERGFTICNVYQGWKQICTLFVTGDVSKHTQETLVTAITLDNPENDVFTINDLKNDTFDDFKSKFGESESDSESLYEKSWENILLCAMFDDKTEEATYIMLLDTDYPYSL